MSRRIVVTACAALFLCTIVFTGNVYSQEQVQIPRVSVLGKVIDAKTGEVLIGANVYIAKSVLGAETNETGYFIIFNVPYGTHRIVASYIGYKVEMKEIRIDSPEVKPLLFKLESDVTELEEVVVSAEAPKNWNRNINKFTEHFIGTSQNAKECTILNPEVLDFEEKENGVFTATASDLLKVENRALGYMIEMYLGNFAIDGNEIYMSYEPHFTERHPENLDQLKQWETERKRAYFGSLRHFLKSLVQGTTDDEEFSFQSLKSIIPYDDPAFQQGRRDISLSQGREQFERTLSFNDFLAIVYHKESEERLYHRNIERETHNVMTYDPTRERAKMAAQQVSYLQMRKDQVNVNTEGVLDDPLSIVTYGYMAWQRVADELPLEYDPAPEGRDIYTEELRPETRFISNMNEADSVKFINEFEYPILLVLNEEEKKHYRGMETLAGRRGFIERYIKSRNQNPLFAVNYWFLEFSGRYYHAVNEFGIEEPPYFDVRGEYYIKYGAPTKRFSDNGGYKKSKTLGGQLEATILKSDPQDPLVIQETSTIVAFTEVYKNKQTPQVNFVVKPNETWYYANGSQEFTVHFVKEGNNWIHIERLEQALENRQQSGRTWHWMELIKEREHISPEYSSLSMEINRFEEIIADAILTVNYVEGFQTTINVPGDMRGEISADQPDRTIAMEKNQVELAEIGDLQRISPTISNRFNDQNTLEFDYDIAQFKGDGGKTRLGLVTHASITDILDKRPEKGSADSVGLNVQYVLRNMDFEPLVIDESSAAVSQARFLNAGFDNIVLLKEFSAEPQSCDLTVQIQDAGEGNRGFRQRLVDVRDFSGTSLMLSDIMLYAPAESYESAGMLPVVTIDDNKLTPYPSITLGRTEPVFCYFEIYNLESAGVGDQYVIEITARTQKEKVSWFKRLFGGSGGVKLSISHNRTVSGNDSRELLSLDVSELKSGSYLLGITVKSAGRPEIAAAIEKPIEIK